MMLVHQNGAAAFAWVKKVPGATQQGDKNGHVTTNCPEGSAEKLQTAFSEWIPFVGSPPTASNELLTTSPLL